jgi:hypothetical protein
MLDPIRLHKDSGSLIAGKFNKAKIKPETVTRRVSIGVQIDKRTGDGLNGAVVVKGEIQI